MIDTSKQFGVFQNTHTLKYCNVSNHEWVFISSGTGPETIVILPGIGVFGSVGAELMFPIITILENSARIISIGYPITCTKVHDIIEGIKFILDNENIEKFSFLSHAYGNIFAECFLSIYPNRVNKLILTNYARPSLSRIRIMKLTLPILIHYPEKRNIKSIKSNLIGILKNYPDQFWVSYLTSNEADKYLKYVNNSYRCILDFVRNWQFMYEKNATWNGRALIFISNKMNNYNAKNGTSIPYINTEIQTSETINHFFWLIHKEEYIQSILDFI